MKHIIRICLLLTFLSSSLTFAADLEQSKRDGLIGERADGYLGLVVESAAADVAALVKDINNKRRDEYRRIAAENNLTMEQVQALAGKKAIERTRSGDWILLNGGWQKK